jgi:hypothetical protein
MNDWISKQEDAQFKIIYSQLLLKLNIEKNLDTADKSALADLQHNFLIHNLTNNRPN